MGKVLLTMNIHFKNEGQEWEVGTSGRERMNGEAKGERIWYMYFIYRIMKPVEIILSSGQGDEGE
jgi:hypothetical protein